MTELEILRQIVQTTFYIHGLETPLEIAQEYESLAEGEDDAILQSRWKELGRLFRELGNGIHSGEL